MDIKIFSNISWRGRVAYAIMCLEKYLVTKEPNKDWTPLSKKLWTITGGKMFLDEWSDRVIDILPKCLLEFKDFASSDFTYLTEEEYNTFKNLYEGLGEDFSQLMEKIHEMEEVYAYTVIDDNGEKCAEILEEIIQILEKNSIFLPDYNLVTFSKFEEKEGRGEPFDGTKLSIVLNKSNLH